jgi:hypothetical protein
VVFFFFFLVFGKWHYGKKLQAKNKGKFKKTGSKALGSVLGGARRVVVVLCNQRSQERRSVSCADRIYS